MGDQDLFPPHGFPRFLGFDSKTVQRSALCRSRRELSNEYLLAKIGVDTAENEPLEVWGKIQFTIHFTPYPPPCPGEKGSWRSAEWGGDPRSAVRVPAREGIRYFVFREMDLRGTCLRSAGATRWGGVSRVRRQSGYARGARYPHQRFLCSTHWKS